MLPKLTGSWLLPDAGHQKMAQIQIYLDCGSGYYIKKEISGYKVQIAVYLQLSLNGFRIKIHRFESDPGAKIRNKL